MQDSPLNFAYIGSMKATSAAHTSPVAYGISTCQWQSLRTHRHRNHEDTEQHRSNVLQLPRSRHKHSACCVGEFVYVFCGKDGTTPLKDIWRLHVRKRAWENIVVHKGSLPFLQGHTPVAYKRLIVIFGGTFSDSLGDIQLWTYNPDLGHVHEVWIEPGTAQPQCRRDHSAVVHNNLMYVYGGFIDSAGASRELWAFNIDEEEWTELTSLSRTQPGHRYGHSAVVYDNSMWVYGGMSGLQPRSDIWKYSFLLHKWKRVKVLGAAPSLSGHTASVIHHHMVVVGGNCMGKPVQEAWAFTFETCTWQKLSSGGIGTAQLPSVAFHSSVIFCPPSPQHAAGVTRSTPHLKAPTTQRLIPPNRFEVRPRSSPAVVADPQGVGDSSGAAAAAQRDAGDRKGSTQIMVLADDGVSAHHAARDLLDRHFNSCNKPDIRIHVSLREPLVSQSPEAPGFYNSCAGQILEEEEMVETYVSRYRNGSAAGENPDDCDEILLDPGSGVTDLSSDSPVLKARDQRQPSAASIQFRNDVFLEDLESADINVLDEVKISYPSKNPFLPMQGSVILDSGQLMSESFNHFRNHIPHYTTGQTLSGEGIELHQIDAHTVPMKHSSATTKARSNTHVDPTRLLHPDTSVHQSKCKTVSHSKTSMCNSNDGMMTNCGDAKSVGSSDLPANPALRPRKYAQPVTSLPIYCDESTNGSASGKELLNLNVELQAAAGKLQTETVQSPCSPGSENPANADSCFGENTSLVVNSHDGGARSESRLGQHEESASSCETKSVVRQVGVLSANNHLKISVTDSCDGQLSEEACGAQAGRACCKDRQETGEPFLLLFGGRTEEHGSVHAKPLAVWKAVLF